MTHVLTIARREISERRLLYAVAPFIAAAPFLFSMLRSSTDRPTRIALTGTILAVCWTTVISAMLGSSLLSRELAEKRLSFYLTKPVSAASLWFGKLLAALILIVTSFAIVLVPSLLAGPSWQNMFSDDATGAVVGILLMASVFVLILFHAMGTMFRSRSAVIFIDIGAAILIAGATMLIAEPFVTRLSMTNAAIVVMIVITGFVLAIVSGGVYQVARGRSDLRESHKALSRFTWTASAGVLAIAALFAAWVFSAGPEDLTDAQVGQAPAGNWAWVAGDAVHRNDFKPFFALNVASGVHYTLPGTMMFGASFSRDGSTALWSRFDSNLFGPTRHRIELMTTHLNGSATHSFTGYTTNDVEASVLSDDGKRMAALDGEGTLSVIDIPSHRILASARIPKSAPGRWIQMFFPNADVVRLYEQSGDKTRQVLRVQEFDVVHRKLTTTGMSQHDGAFLRFALTADGARMVIRSGPREHPAATMVDGRTLQAIASLNAGIGFSSVALSDGGAALAESRGDVRSIAIYGPDGAERHRIALKRRSLWIMGEIAPAKVVALLEGPAVAVIDTARGVVDREEAGFIIADPFAGSDPRGLAPNARQNLLVTDKQGKLWRWNPLTGEKSRIGA